MSEVTIVNLQPEMAGDLEQIELTCFPMANPDDLLSKEDIIAYAEVFPEGYFVAMADGRPVGMGAGIYLDFDFDHPQHTIAGITGEHQCANHDPEATGTTGPTSRSSPSIGAGESAACCTSGVKTW